MILVTGGLGFIGQHVARALLDSGETCVLTQYRTKRQPSLIKNEIGSRVFIEPMDVTNAAEFVGLGKKYNISGIVHLPGGFSLGGPRLYEDIRASMVDLANALQAAQEWQVRRIAVASTLGVYVGVTTLPWREDQPLAFTASFPIEAFKKTRKSFVPLSLITRGWIVSVCGSPRCMVRFMTRPEAVWREGWSMLPSTVPSPILTFGSDRSTRKMALICATSRTARGL